MSLGIIAMLLSRTTAFSCSLRPVQYKVDYHKQAGDFQPHKTDEFLFPPKFRNFVILFLFYCYC